MGRNLWNLYCNASSRNWTLIAGFSGISSRKYELQGLFWGILSLFLVLWWLILVWGVFPPQGNIYWLSVIFVTLSAFLLPPLQWHPLKCGDLPAFQPGWSVGLHHHLCHSPLEYLHLKTHRKKTPKNSWAKKTNSKTTEQPQGKIGEKIKSTMLKQPTNHKNNKQKIPPKNSTIPSWK